MAREIPELSKPGKDVSRERQTIIGEATVPEIAERIALSRVLIADPEGLPTVLRSREASEEERTEHGANHDCGRSWVFGSPQFGHAGLECSVVHLMLGKVPDPVLEIAQQ